MLVEIQKNVGFRWRGKFRWLAVGGGEGVKKGESGTNNWNYDMWGLRQQGAGLRLE